MTLTFEFEEFEIVEETKDDYIIWKTVLCEVDLVMTEPPDPGTPPSLSYPGDPPWPAVFEIEEVRLIDIQDGDIFKDEVISVALTETQFTTFFPGGQDVVNNAFEWAAEQEIDYDG